MAIRIGLILLGVGQTALQLSKSARALRRRQVFQLGQDGLLFFETPPDGKLAIFRPRTPERCCLQSV